MTDVWPFQPVLSCQEELQFLTDVLPTRTREQRLALRVAPRSQFVYSSKLERGQDFSRAKILARYNGAEKFYAPNWGESTRYIGAIASGDTSIAMDTNAGDWRVGSPAIVWGGDDSYSVVTIATVAPTSLGFTGTIGANYTDPIVMPIRLVSMPNGVNIDRAAMLGDFSVTLQVHDERDLSSLYVSTYPTYLGLEVVTDRPWLVEPARETIMRDATYNDSELGLVVIDDIKNYADISQTLTFLEERGVASFKRKCWLHHLRGRQKAFWMPGFQNDFPVIANIGAAATTIQIASVGPTGFYIGKHMMLETHAGVRYFRNITNASNLGDVDTLTISSALGVAVAVAEIRYTTIIIKSRIASDTISIKHNYSAHSIISMPTTGVPDV